MAPRQPPDQTPVNPKPDYVDNPEVEPTPTQTPPNTTPEVEP